MAKSIRIHQRISPFGDGVVAVLHPQWIQKQTEESAIAPEADYQELANHISEAFFALTGTLSIKHWNKAAEMLFSHSVKATIGKTVWELFPEWKGTSLERLFLSSIRTKRPQTIVNEYRKKDGLLYLEVRDPYP
jgi:PAS domain S-box-containing protein